MRVILPDGACQDVPAMVVVEPTSCRCGGTEAYALDFGGYRTSLGCVCHTWFDMSTGTFERRMDEPANPGTALRHFWSHLSDMSCFRAPAAPLT